MITIIRASENNLKDVSLQIPKRKITVFTGVSGSGKSSLCLDTIAAESRRELNETFPTFIQQYLPKYGRPKVEHIDNMPVTIVIDQKKPAPNNRSTVGTYTDIYALLRLLLSALGNDCICCLYNNILNILKFLNLSNKRNHDFRNDFPCRMLLVDL